MVRDHMHDIDIQKEKQQETEKSSAKLPTETSAESAPANHATVPTGSTKTILQLILGQLFVHAKQIQCVNVTED